MAGPIYFVVKVSANRQTATTYHWQNAWWTWRIPLTLLTAPKCYVRMADTTTVQSKPSCQVNRAIVGLKCSSFFTARLQACTVWRSVCLPVSLSQVKILWKRLYWSSGFLAWHRLILDRRNMSTQPDNGEQWCIELFGMVRLNSNEFLTLRNQPHLRGHKYVTNINKRRCSNNRRNNFFSIRIVNLWNNLPSSTTDFTSFRKFDKSLNNDYLLLYCKLNFT